MRPVVLVTLLLLFTHTIWADLADFDRMRRGQIVRVIFPDDRAEWPKRQDEKGIERQT
jgi:hypothetical protein